MDRPIATVLGKQMTAQYDPDGRLRMFFADDFEYWFRVSRFPVFGTIIVMRAVWQKKGSRGALRRSRAEQTPRWVHIFQTDKPVSDGELLLAMIAYIPIWRGKMKVEVRPMLSA